MIIWRQFPNVAFSVLAILLGGFLSTAPAALTLEIVNDNDNPANSNPDSNTYMLVVGNDGSFSGTTGVAYHDLASSGTTTGLPLSGVTSGTTVHSIFTGMDRPVHTFSIDNLASGLIYISTGTGVTYAGATAPTAHEPYRFDQMELTYEASNPTAGSGDLTSIGFLGIPMQMETFDSGGNPLDVRTFYSSLATIVNQFPSQIAPAFIATGTAGAQWNQTSFSDFARILSPGTLVPESGSPAPYPSFTDYLQSLVDASYTWTVSGTNSFPAVTYTLTGTSGTQYPYVVNPYTGTYNYTCSIIGTKASGYTISGTGTVVLNQATAPYTSGTTTLTGASTFTMNLPSSSSGSPTDNLDFFTYGAVLNNESFSITPAINYAANPDSPDVTNTAFFNQVVPNSIYANAVGDVYSALNFGYLNGTSGTNGAVWYQNFPQAFPFGATSSNPAQGYYNAYAATLYNTSDSYGFAFSDRGGRPSPLIGFPDGGTLRITILPDQRLDAPRVSLAGSSTSSLSIQWPVVSSGTGFSVGGYTVAVEPAPGTISIPPAPTIAGGTASMTITGLEPYSPYEITVTTTGTNNSNSQAVSSNALPVTFSTSGTASPSPAGTIPLQIGVNVGAPFIGDTIAVGGQPGQQVLSGTQNIQFPVQANPGFNSYVLTISGTVSGTSTFVYQSNYLVEFTGTSSTSSLTFATNPSLPLTIALQDNPGLQNNTQPLTVSAAPMTGTSTQFPYPGPYENGGMVIGTPFVPVELKKYTPVVFADAATPTPTPATPTPTPATPTPTPATPTPTPATPTPTPATPTPTPATPTPTPATPTPTPAPQPTPVPPPAPVVTVDGKKTIKTDKKSVVIKGNAIGTKVFVKYKNGHKLVTKHVKINAVGDWKFKFKPTVKKTVLKFYSENSGGAKSGLRKVKVIDSRD